LLAVACLWMLYQRSLEAVVAAESQTADRPITD
jgi:hypothetical protein